MGAPNRNLASAPSHAPTSAVANTLSNRRQGARPDIPVGARPRALPGLTLAALLLSAIPLSADDAPAGDGSLAGAFTGGKAWANFNLRLETVSQDNIASDAEALTLRSILGFDTAAWKGFSASLAFHDSRPVFGVDDYSVPQTGFKPGEYPVIPDPETTELDQAWLQWAHGGFSARLGRQLLTWDDQRFVGDVGWRQDRQTFDALSLKLAPIEKVTLMYAHVTQRNRIFAEDADIDASDHLLNAAWTTPLGTLVGFGYLLEADDTPGDGPDTWGLRFSGKHVTDGPDWLYAASWATQSADTGSASFDADYWFAEFGAVLGPVTLKAGYEVLGSDDGAYGFATPLATLHKFNGWADQFLTTPAQGLRDLYASAGGGLWGGQWAVAWHDFEADDPVVGADDFGSELDISYARKFADHFTVGIKYARYDAAASSGGRADTDKFWTWVNAVF